jgi:hypothetical protein
MEKIEHSKTLLVFTKFTSLRYLRNHHLPNRHRRLPNHLHRRSSMSPQHYRRHINSKTYPCLENNLLESQTLYS